MRNATVRAIWACADLLNLVQGALIMLASVVVGEDDPPQDDLVRAFDARLGAWEDDPRNTHAADYPRLYQ